MIHFHFWLLDKIEATVVQKHQATTWVFSRTWQCHKCHSCGVGFESQKKKSGHGCEEKLRQASCDMATVPVELPMEEKFQLKRRPLDNRIASSLDCLPGRQFVWLRWQSWKDGATKLFGA